MNLYKNEEHDNNQSLYYYGFLCLSQLDVPRNYFIEKTKIFDDNNRKRDIKVSLYITQSNSLICICFSPYKDILEKKRLTLIKDTDHKVHLINKELEIIYLPFYDQLEYFRYVLLPDEDIINNTVELIIKALENPSAYNLEKTNLNKESKDLINNLIQRIDNLETKSEQLYKKVFLGNGTTSIVSSISKIETIFDDLKLDIDKLDLRLGEKVDKEDLSIFSILAQTNIKYLFISLSILVSICTLGSIYLGPKIENIVKSTYEILH